ncbi:MAG: HlyD family efflux transporter periplasmic adaptor subunit [Clostridia bacterium]|nr:HlyD family efflux transporter periplasmic adaptor subunit [Clostridia bacterium]
MQKVKQLFQKILQSGRQIAQKIFSFALHHKVWASAIALVLIGALVLTFLPKKGNRPTMGQSNEATVSRRDIAEVVSGSSVVEPNAEYTLVSMVTGEILEAPFEEGDVVTEGQLMYRFDAADAEKDMERTQLSIQKSQLSYQDTMENIRNLNVTSTVTGTVREVMVKEGDSVNNGTQIATVYDDSHMEIRLPFNASEAGQIQRGDTAVLTLVTGGTVLYGTVTAISSAAQSSGGYMSVRYVTIEVPNPGALTASDSATAMIGDIACNDIGTFEPVMDYKITAKASGTVDTLSISAGDRVSKGDVVAILDSTSAQTQRLNAEISMRDAELSLEKVQEQLDEYNITAPISGTVVTKNKKAGDKIESGVSSTDNTLALIYDMSSLCFELAIDELDIKKIQVGQDVTVTADASDQIYHGTVENVSVSGSVGTNGVTTYPVKIRIQDFDDALLPGMNIEAEISIQAVTNVLAVPISAIQRGDIVYVKGEKTEEKDRAPEGYHSVSVTCGVSNDSFVEILSGLSEGDIVYVPVQETQQTMMFPGMGGMPGSGMPGGGMPGGGMSGNRGGMPSGGGMR